MTRFGRWRDALNDVYSLSVGTGLVWEHNFTAARRASISMLEEAYAVHILDIWSIGEGRNMAPARGEAERVSKCAVNQTPVAQNRRIHQLDGSGDGL